MGDKLEDNLIERVARLEWRADAFERRQTENEILGTTRHEQNRKSIHDVIETQSIIIDKQHNNQLETIEYLKKIDTRLAFADGGDAADNRHSQRRKDLAKGAFAVVGTGGLIAAWHWLLAIFKDGHK